MVSAEGPSVRRLCHGCDGSPCFVPRRRTLAQWPFAQKLPMPSPNQIVIPRSFIELFIPPGSHKPIAPRDHIAERYDLCEDMAQMLTEPARERLLELGIAEADVLERMYAGLSGGTVVDESEARWIVRRLAELLQWEPLALPTHAQSRGGT